MRQTILDGFLKGALTVGAMTLVPDYESREMIAYAAIAAEVIDWSCERRRLARKRLENKTHYTRSMREGVL